MEFEEYNKPANPAMAQFTQEQLASLGMEPPVTVSMADLESNTKLPMNSEEPRHFPPQPPQPPQPPMNMDGPIPPNDGYDRDAFGEVRPAPLRPEGELFDGVTVIKDPKLPLSQLYRQNGEFANPVAPAPQQPEANPFAQPQGSVPSYIGSTPEWKPEQHAAQIQAMNQPPMGQPPQGQPPMGQPMGQPPMGQPMGQPPMGGMGQRPAQPGQVDANGIPMSMAQVAQANQQQQQFGTGGMQQPMGMGQQNIHSPKSPMVEVPEDLRPAQTDAGHNFPWDNTFDKLKKPHKFFSRKLNNNLEEVASDLRFEYNRIANLEMYGIQPHTEENDIFTYSKSVSTQKSREYNAFQMYYPWIHELYSAIVDMTREACEYYEIDYNSEQWMAQAWFNINSTEKDGKLNWHDHIDPNMKIPAFHGYYSVNAEPSQTFYDINGEKKANDNKNNTAILSMVGFPHAMGPWEWQGDRITVAYDVIPLKTVMQKDFLAAPLKPHEKFWEQHYFPLPKIY